MKKTSTLLICFVLTLLTIVCTAFFGNETVSAATIKLSASKKTIYVGKTAQLKLKNAKGKVTWTSSNEKVATVNDKGLVTAVKKGSAIIIASYNNEFYSCKVTVKNPAISTKNAELKVGETLTLTMKGASPQKFTSNRKSVAKVSEDGLVTAIKAGSAVISVKCDNGKTYKCTLTITDEKIDSTKGNCVAFTGEDRSKNTYDNSMFADYELTMVNCIESWCGPCKSEMPDINKLYETYKSEGFNVIGVCTDWNGIDNMIKETGVTYPIIKSSTLANEYSAGAIPLTFFVDKNGDVLTHSLSQSDFELIRNGNSSDKVKKIYVGSNTYSGWETIIKKYLNIKE